MAAICLFDRPAKEGMSLPPINAAGADQGSPETRLRRTAFGGPLWAGGRSVSATRVERTVSGPQRSGFQPDG
jgi:hypothetical protein